MAATNRYDAVIVGGGHNGLVAGFYLARAGLRPLILERRELVGGCCVTEEFAPGFRASTGAYVISMLREPVWRDMRLASAGSRSTPPVRRCTGSPTGSGCCSARTSPPRRSRSAASPPPTPAPCPGSRMPSAASPRSSAR